MAFMFYKLSMDANQQTTKPEHPVAVKYIRMTAKARYWKYKSTLTLRYRNAQMCKNAYDVWALHMRCMS